MTAAGSPYNPLIGTIDRDMWCLRWSQAFMVETTNSGSHYWTIAIRKGLAGTPLITFNTSSYSANTWHRIQLDEIDFSVITATTGDVMLSVYCTVTLGTPGILHVASPALLFK